MRFIKWGAIVLATGTLVTVAGVSSSTAKSEARCVVGGQPTVCYPLDRNSVAEGQVVNGSLDRRDMNPATQAAFLKDTDTDEFGKQGGTLIIPQTAIDKIGGSFATNATKVGEFTLGKGTWLVNAAVMFDRIDANNADYQTPTTDTMPSFVLRYPGDAGTVMGNSVSRAGYVELTGSSVKTIVLTEDTKVTAYGFGYNEDRSGFGSTDNPAGAKAQFSVAGAVTAVRVG